MASALASNDASILSLPDELLEDILENVLLGLRPKYTLEWRVPSKDIHYLSRTCRRFRRILLPRLYRNVRLLGRRPGSKLRFLELMPVHGYLCETLAFRISGSNGNFCAAVRMLKSQFYHLTKLRVLELDVRLDDDSRNPVTSWSPGLRTRACGTLMDNEELACLGGLCEALPNIKELHLYGFAWDDAADGLYHAGPFPSIGKLALHLGPSKSDLETARTLNRVFSGLNSIDLPSQWCPTQGWIREAFAHRNLESIAITDEGGSSHRCFAWQCEWPRSIALLLRLHSATLTTLDMKSSLLTCLRLDGITFPSLTTLILCQPSSDYAHKFDEFIQPFLASPLRKLSVYWSHGVLESFCSWFEPGSGRWPNLKTLSLDGICTELGPGDELWDDATSEERDEWDRLDEGNDHWRSHTRIALEQYRVERGIHLQSEWQWFEGFG